MKSIQSLLVFAAVAIAQNEFPDPDYEPVDQVGIQISLDLFADTVRPIAQEVRNINTSTVSLDKAIIAFVGPEGVQPALSAASSLLQTLSTSNTNIQAIAKIPEDDAGSTGDLLPYVNSLSYHVNHTVNNLVAKKALAASLCQGPTVFTAIQNTQSQAQAFIDTVTSKIPDSLLAVVPGLTDPIVAALSSASSAFADQTTTAPGCNPSGGGGEISTYPTTTTTTTGGSTYPTTTTTTPDGSSYSTTTKSGGSTYPTVCRSRRRHRAEKQL